VHCILSNYANNSKSQHSILDIGNCGELHNVAKKVANMVGIPKKMFFSCIIHNALPKNKKYKRGILWEKRSIKI
jgi:hypothetical protein